MKRTIAFGLNSFETMPASMKNRAMTLKEISLEIKDLHAAHVT